MQSRLILTFLFVTSFILLVTAQETYRISLEPEGYPADTFYLAHYYTDKFFIVDTSFNNSELALFEGDSLLPQGIYLLANAKKEKIVEFLIPDKQRFSIKLFADGSMPEITDSQENIWFFEHIEKSNATFKQIDSLQKIASELSADLAIDYQNQINELTHSLNNYRAAIVAQSPESLFGTLLKVMEEPVIPDSIQTDQHASFMYYKTHYWDNIDLSDERLLNTPFLPHKLETYFNRLILPQADSVIKEIDFLIEKAGESQKTIDYLVWHFVSEYQNPKIMGLDKVFVYLSDMYFRLGRVSNITASILEQISERADKIRPNLIGSMAPDMWLVDSTDVFRSFREIEANYTVLFFWDQTCSHCKKEMEILDAIYKSRKYDLEIFAINTTNDFEGWKHFIAEKKYPWIQVNGTKSLTPDFHNLYDIYSVPVLYLLNKNKIIIGKRFGAEHLEEIIDHSVQN